MLCSSIHTLVGWSSGKLGWWQQLLGVGRRWASSAARQGANMQGGEGAGLRQTWVVTFRRVGQASLPGAALAPLPRHLPAMGVGSATPTVAQQQPPMLLEHAHVRVQQQVCGGVARPPMRGVVATGRSLVLPLAGVVCSRPSPSS
jgi:hypothetical protein